MYASLSRRGLLHGRFILQRFRNTDAFLELTRPCAAALRALLCLVTVLIATGCNDDVTAPDSGLNTVFGQVTSSVTRAPIVGAEVTLGTTTVVTGSDGRFRVTDRTLGSTTLRCRADLYGLFEEAMSFNGGTRYRNIVLTPVLLPADEVLGIYDLTAPITESDPAWGIPEGTYYSAVVTLDEADEEGYGGTFANWVVVSEGDASAIAPEGSGRVKAHVYQTGDVSMQVDRIFWAMEGRRLPSGDMEGMFGCCGHITGTFTAVRRLDDTPGAGEMFATLVGTVVNAVTLSPVSGAEVTLGATTVVTGSDGRFTVTDETVGATTLQARAVGFEAFAMDIIVPSGPSDRDIKLTPIPVVSEDVLGTYDLTATITGSDPAWGIPDGSYYSAVVTLEGVHENGFTGTIVDWISVSEADTSLVAPDGTGQLAGVLYHGGEVSITANRLDWGMTGHLLPSGDIEGRFGCCGHIGGTFTAVRRSIQ